ncbi:MAG TPA: Bax inhibitor-1/YccA family protein, partial [Flavisolibacter sp.]|nr:Bax inhibitor-1/YccA family protein [Flavisolibacter sp.]
MGLFKGGNPAMSEKTFEQVQYLDGDAMTVRGTMNKFGLMFIMLLGGASFTWSMFYQAGPAAVMPWMWGSLIGGFVLSLVIIFKKTW